MSEFKLDLKLVDSWDIELADTPPPLSERKQAMGKETEPRTRAVEQDKEGTQSKCEELESNILQCGGGVLPPPTQPTGREPAG